MTANLPHRDPMATPNLSTRQKWRLVYDGRRARDSKIDYVELGYQGEVTTLTLKPYQAEEIDAIKNGLYVEGRTFQFNSATNKLTVDSTNCPVHE
ncbi:MAG: hypothetical protein KKC24_18900 [Gammaproteobacteria bacterium]|uniref:hypothetical protein n=1 Tax=Pseudomonas TaxID=286 RepID=UPI00098B9561|nr:MULTISPECIES: hypothetical protein [Pseudomonas]MBU0523639.1 hypothetical protein [Gammaproteobacteria bacterium]MBS4086658.1 hypothetical protein [Pseudomonas rustica]MBU0820917.1 hypothetical protein [Gammaproteobacteria bacterium]MBU0844660.1 hypothetical protein [Gammaproteobacteria bacterium]MBU1842964.1 hypothetical protein [Gammaproteobacteria bacterium]